MARTDEEALKVLDEEFDTDFEEVARKTKKKRRRWIILVALGIAITISFIFSAIDGAVMRHQRAKTAEMSNIYNEISNPNVYLRANNGASRPFGAFGGSFSLQTYKNIAGYAVSWGSETWNYGLTSQSFTNSAFSATSPIMSGAESGKLPSVYFANGTNQKIAMFFTPNYGSRLGAVPAAFDGAVTSTNTKEVTTLGSVNNQLAEVAVTFDKPYTYAEIQKMVPSNLMINWYWLGINDKQMNAAGTINYVGLNSGGSIDWRNGKQYWNPSYKLTNSMYTRFVNSVKDAQGMSYFKQLVQTFSADGKTVKFEPYKDGLKQVEKYDTLDKAKFSGVILTGRTQNFAAIENKSWVYATNVGVTTPIMPYLKPLK